MSLQQTQVVTVYEVALQGLCRVWSQILQVLDVSKSSPCSGRFFGFSLSDLLMKFSPNSSPESVDAKIT